MFHRRRLLFRRRRAFARPHGHWSAPRGSAFDTLPERAETQRGLVAVAMSGGVDSSTVAALLQQQRYAVVGLTMQLWNQRRLPELQGDGPAQHRCCSLDDVYDAKAVARHLNF